MSAEAGREVGEFISDSAPPEIFSDVIFSHVEQRSSRTEMKSMMAEDNGAEDAQTSPPSLCLHSRRTNRSFQERKDSKNEMKGFATL